MTLPKTVAFVPYPPNGTPPMLAAAAEAATELAGPIAAAADDAEPEPVGASVATTSPSAAALAALPAQPGIAPAEVATFIALPETSPLPPAQPIAFVRADPAAMLAPTAVAPRSEVDGLIAKYATLYEVPVDLVRRVVKRESNFNPKARNRVYWGLMQIRRDTAAGMGYRGTATGLLDPETNLKYAVKYLRGAYLVARGNHDRADRLYQSGYYYDAKRMGLLEETGLRAPRP